MSAPESEMPLGTKKSSVSEMTRFYLLGELVGVSTVSIYMAERGRSSSIAEQMQKLVDTLRIPHMKARGPDRGYHLRRYTSGALV